MGDRQALRKRYILRVVTHVCLLLPSLKSSAARTVDVTRTVSEHRQPGRAEIESPITTRDVTRDVTRVPIPGPSLIDNI